MRILAIQFATNVHGKPVPRFHPQLGTLIALLKQRGHDVALIGIARPDLQTVKQCLAKHLPKLIYADIAAVCSDLARRVLQYVNDHEFVPVVAGGDYATVDPSTCLSLPGVQAVAIGENDASFLTYVERLEDPAMGQVVRGIWSRDERGLARPDLPELVEDLDSLALPERDPFDYRSWIQRTGEIEIAVARGCPQQCAYCTNDWLQEIYDGHGTWLRYRSPDAVCDEIDCLRNRYNTVRRIRFLDHAFALNPHWLHAMLTRYRETCDLPFRCHLRLNALNADLVRSLADAGCRWSDVELISGSDFIRNEIFDMDLSGDQIRAGFRLLRDAGIETRAIAYLGAPYESEVSMEETRSLLLQLKPATVDIRHYYPWPGTRARETARDNGWLHVRGEEQYHRDAPGIDMPACRPDLITRFVKRLRKELSGNAGAWWRLGRAGRTAFPQILSKRQPGSRL